MSILALSYQWRDREHTYDEIGFVLCYHVLYGVRPAISLIPGTYITGGNGTADTPWTVSE